MVVFHCGGCGEALKKNQVDKHIGSICRRVQTLSCIDCGKDFTYNKIYFIYYLFLCDLFIYFLVVIHIKNILNVLVNKKNMVVQIIQHQQI